MYNVIKMFNLITLEKCFVLFFMNLSKPAKKLIHIECMKDYCGKDILISKFAKVHKTLSVSEGIKVIDYYGLIDYINYELYIYNIRNFDPGI